MSNAQEIRKLPKFMKRIYLKILKIINVIIMIQNFKQLNIKKTTINKTAMNNYIEYTSKDNRYKNLPFSKYANEIYQFLNT